MEEGAAAGAGDGLFLFRTSSSSDVSGATLRLRGRVLPPAVEEETPTDTARASPTVPAEVLGALVEIGAAVEEVELAVKERPLLRGPTEELRLGPEVDGTEGGGSGAGVSSSLWILSRAERFSSSRSSTVML